MDTKIIANLSGAAIDTLYSLSRAPRFDGDVPSKVGRNELIELGLAKRDRKFEDGPNRGCMMNELTPKGREIAAHYHYKNAGAQEH